jgi:hypothetical protein
VIPAETITAWENMRNDFGWMLSLDPRVVQGLLTFLSAATAAAVALYIARTIYPIQKDKDREIKIDEEKRLVYRDFLKNINGLINQRLLDEQAEKLRAVEVVKAALNEVLVFADKDTAEAMVRLFNSAALLVNKLNEQPTMGELEPALYQEELGLANDCFKSAINAARGELGVEPLEAIVELTLLTTSPKVE